MATYEFVIRKEGSKSKTNPIAGSSSSSDNERKGLLSKEGAQAFVKGYTAYKTIKSFGTQIVNHQVSLVELRTGSQELQQRANFINQLVQDGLGIVESIAVGAALGSLPGALVGLTLSVAHKAIGYSQAQQTIETKRDVETVSLMMNYIRAGANSSRRND